MEIVSWLSKQASKIADNLTNDYHFYIKTLPQHPIDSSTLLSLTTYSDRQELALVPCSYRWFRIKNKIVQQRVEFKGSSYICGLLDIGSLLQVEVKSLDSQHPGIAILNYGPVRMDASLKQAVKYNLNKESIPFLANILIQGQQLQCTIQINKDLLTFTYKQSIFSISYYLGNVKIQVQHLSNKIRFALNSDLESYSQFISKIISKRKGLQEKNEIEVVFSNRKLRDQFWATMKAFNAEKQLKNIIITNKVERLRQEDSHVDLLSEIQSLRNDTIKMYSAYCKERQERFVYFAENVKLEQQISEILQAYSKLLEGNSPQQKKSNHMISFKKESKQLQREHKVIKSSLKTLKQQKQKIQQKSSQSSLHALDKFQKEEIFRQNINLKQQIRKLNKKISILQTQKFDNSETELQRYIDHPNPMRQPDLNPQTQIEISKFKAQVELMNERVQLAKQQIKNLKNLIIKLQLQKAQWKSKQRQLIFQLQNEKQSTKSKVTKLQGQIKDLQQQINSTKRSNDVINRSFNASLQFQDYNYQQNKVLRQQNDFLLLETQKLTKLCSKYKSQFKEIQQSNNYM